MTPSSFGFLAALDSLLVTVGGAAWRYTLSDRAVSLVEKRTLAELLAKGAAAFTGVEDRALDQTARIRALTSEGVLDADVQAVIVAVRRADQHIKFKHD